MIIKNKLISLGKNAKYHFFGIYIYINLIFIFI